MARFLGRLQLAQVIDSQYRPVPTADGRSNWIVMQNLSFEDDDGEMLTAKVGFETDLGSIPQIAWSLGFPPDGIGDPAYVIHDMLCATNGTGAWRGDIMVTRDTPYSYIESAEVLRRALAVCGVAKQRRDLIADAVIQGGPRF